MTSDDRLIAAIVGAGGSASGANAIVEDLWVRHLEPHRKYHTGEHVGEVLAELDRLDRAASAEVLIAARFHDAIYDVHAPHGDSEAASADLAADQLTAAGIPAGAPLAAEVCRLILLTAGHQVDPGDQAGALLVDADLWILSAPVERYDRYAADVRQEYAHVPDDLWRSGRGAVLQHFLDAADDLYAFGPDDDRATRRQRARANLTRELDALDALGD